MHKEAAIIEAAPWSFGFIVVILFLLTYWINRYVYKERLDKATNLMNLYKEQSLISPARPTEAPRNARSSLYPMRSHIQVLGLDPLPIEAGRVVAGTVIFKNDGQVDAHVAVFTYVYIVNTPAPDQQERYEYILFDQFIQNQIFNDNPTHTIPPGNQLLRIHAGPILSDEQARDLKAGKQTIYFMGTVRYRDSAGTHHADYCRYVNANGFFSCKKHNEEP